MKIFGKVYAGIGVGIWVLFMIFFIQTGVFIMPLFLIVTGFALYFIVQGISCINKANDAEASEQQFRKLEDEHSKYRATYNNIEQPMVKKTNNQTQEKNNDDDWFKV